MITCNYCGQKNRDDSLECRKCGAPLGESESLQEKLASVKGGWFSTPGLIAEAMEDKPRIEKILASELARAKGKEPDINDLMGCIVNTPSTLEEYSEVASLATQMNRYGIATSDWIRNNVIMSIDADKL